MSDASQERTRQRLLIAFVDFTLFNKQSERISDTEIADTMDEYYTRVASAVKSAGGTVVKFIGDAVLIVFPESAGDAGVRTLIELKPALDRFMAERNWECRLHVKAHFGEVVAGPFGPDGDKRFDIIGRAVNTAAMLKTDGITLSAEAFEQLSPDLRKRFAKKAPLNTYSLVDESRPDR